MLSLTPKRVDAEELLDEHDAPVADMHRSLRDLRRINKYLGGIGVYRRLLKKLGRDVHTVAVLDLGAGTADLLDSLPLGAMRVALDFKIDHLLLGRHGSNAKRVVGDAMHLPFRDDSVDVVTSSHFFHHFSEEENAAILQESLRVARVGVAVNDTLRHHVPLLVTRMLGWLRLVGRITRFDAPASVLRGYTASEVQHVASRVPAARRRVLHLWPYRYGLLLWKRT